MSPSRKAGSWEPVFADTMGVAGYVHHLAVAESHRRGRLGIQLLGSCLEALREAGIPKCHAFVFHASPYGKLFWEPAGWERRDDLLIYSMYS